MYVQQVIHARMLYYAFQLLEQVKSTEELVRKRARTH